MMLHNVACERYVEVFCGWGLEKGVLVVVVVIRKSCMMVMMMMIE